MLARGGDRDSIDIVRPSTSLRARERIGPQPRLGPDPSTSLRMRRPFHLESAQLYLLRCADGSYYAATTRASLEMRVAQHNDGTFGGDTSRRRRVVLVYSSRSSRRP